MKIKCNKCGKELNIRIDNIEITHYKNQLLSQDELMINVRHQTFCNDCGELLYGVTRKCLTYEEILKLMEDKNYGKH